LRTNNFDPLAYIESAFLDTKSADELDASVSGNTPDLDLPTMREYIGNADSSETNEDGGTSRRRFRKTVMSAPRPRRASQKKVEEPVIDADLQQIWSALPKNVEFLCSFYDDSVTANYYRGEFKESRQDLIRRLLDPELSLEETSRLLGVCPATVRRYTNRGWLAHHRTTGGQRRFRLSDIVKFVDEHGRFPQE
jgi:excisionase family DNA binding protein